MRPTAFSAAFLLAIVACGGDAGPDAGSSATVADSAGVRLVSLPPFDELGVESVVVYRVGL